MRTNTLVETDRSEGIRGMASGGGDLVGSGDGFGALAGGATEIVYTARKVEVMRDDARVLAKIKAHAAVAGEGWFYRFPVRNKNGGKDSIEGPSIKCANSVARLYGNCQIDTVVKDMGRTFIIYARFIDHETGFSYMRPFQQDKFASKMGGSGPEADARRIDIALQIGTSKAIRNVICNALETFTNYAFEEAKKDLVGRIGKELPRFKEMSKKRLEEMKVDIKRVETMYGRTFDQWLAPEIARLAAEMKAIDDGMATIDETWPPPAPAAPSRQQFKDGEDGGQPNDQANADNGQAENANKDPGTPAAAASGEAQAQPAASPSDASKDKPKGDQKADAPDKAKAKSWAVDPAIVGQDNKIAAINQLLLTTRTPKEVDALEAEHLPFIDKLGQVKKAEMKGRIKARRDELNEGRDE